MWDSKEDLVDSCLEETGGLGVDIIIDSGGLQSLYMTFVTISTKSSLMCCCAVVYDFEPFFLTVRLCDEEPEAQRHCPHKHDLLTLLSVGGHWVTTEQHLQVSSFFKTQFPYLFCIPEHSTFCVLIM